MKTGSYAVRRMTALLLCAALAVTSFISLPVKSYAAVDSSDTEAVKSIAYNMMDIEEQYYSDDFFRGDSEPYNTSLAAMSYSVCNMSYRSWRNPADDRGRNLREFLLDNGFEDYEANEDYNNDGEMDSAAVACAHKTITDNGKTYTLLAVIPRSGTTRTEFERVLHVCDDENDKGDSAGFERSKNTAVKYVRKYIREHGISGNLKVWTTGYSGGGSACNLLSAEMINDPGAVLGNPGFKSSDLYSYCFSPLRVAANGSDPKNSKYDCIHNSFDGADLLMNLIPSVDFDRYGTDYRVRDFADKDKALEIMKIENEKYYNNYVEVEDPDKFAAYKIDFEALVKDRNLVLTEDEDSYLADEDDPDQLATYLNGVSESIAEVCAEAGNGDSRKGYYNVYQEPITDLISFFFEYGIAFDRINIFMKAFTETDTSIPLVLSMYTGFMVDKSINLSDRELRNLIEENFNRIASVVEDDEGNLNSMYRGLRAYDSIKEKFFTLSDEDGETRYELSSSLSRKRRSLLLESLKTLTGRLYAKSLREALEEGDIPEENIEILTGSEEKYKATAWFLTYFLFDNGMQSDKIEPFNPENEQFCQLATFMGNRDVYIAMHSFNYLFAWHRAADPYCADYTTGTTAQRTGYRRVFIMQPSGVSVSGTVTDANGQTVASFKDGKITSRSDEWIGITTADSGNWLRLPVDHSYKVNVKVSGDTSLSFRIADYSIADAVEARSVDSDKSGSWRGLEAKPGDSFTLDIPAVPESKGVYDLTGAAYTLNVVKASSDQAVNIVYSKAVPKAKSVSAKAGKKSFTVKWKKLSSKQRKKFSKVQIQYSTSKDFSNAKTVNVSKSKKSYKIKKLKKCTTYYVRVRNIKKSGDTIYVSKWYKTKKVKTR